MLYAIACKDKLDILYFDNNVIYETEDLKRKFKKEALDYTTFGLAINEVLQGKELFDRMILQGKFIVTPWSQIIRTAFIKENNIKFEENIIHEDNLFSFLAIMAAKRTKHIAIKKYYRRIRNESTITKKTGDKNCIGYLECIKQISEFLDNNKLEDETASRLFLLNLYKTSLKIYVGLRKSNKKMVKKKYRETLRISKILKSINKIKIVTVYRAKRWKKIYEKECVIHNT